MDPLIRGILDAHGAPAPIERPWEPHERNYSGGRFGVWHDDKWTMLRVEAGIADATASIKDHEAWDLALRLSPALGERLDYLFKEMKRAQAALHQFTWADTLAPTLRKVADEWDCGGSCEYAGGAHQCPLMEREEGCRFIEADEMRQFADSLEVAAKMRTEGYETSGEMQAGPRRATPKGSRMTSPIDTTLVERLGDEADLCRNDGARDIADLLDEARAALADSGGEERTKVPPLERPYYCEPHEFLLLASYCGDDNDDCTEKRPCTDCLAMCNVFGEDGKFLRELGNARTQERS